MSIDTIANNLYEQVVSRFDESGKTNETPLFVIIGGVPGAGKTTITNALKSKLANHFKNEIKDQSFVEDTEKEREILDDLTNGYATNVKTDLKDLIYETDVVNYDTYKQDINEKCVSIRSIGGYGTSIEIETGLSYKESDAIYTVPMDGFHIPMETLQQYKEADKFVKIRGNYTTFDSKNYIEFIRVLCTLLTKTKEYSKTDKNIGFKVRYPGFDHAVGDPKANTYELTIKSQGLANPKVIIFEGLYNLFDESNYGRDIAKILKQFEIPHISFFIDGSEDVLERRVSQRHLDSGLVKTLEEGVLKFRNNDLINGKLVREKLITDEDLVVINND